MIFISLKRLQTTATIHKANKKFKASHLCVCSDHISNACTEKGENHFHRSTAKKKSECAACKSCCRSHLCGRRGRKRGVHQRMAGASLSGGSQKGGQRKASRRMACGGTGKAAALGICGRRPLCHFQRGQERQFRICPHPYRGKRGLVHFPRSSPAGPCFHAAGRI